MASCVLRLTLSTVVCLTVDFVSGGKFGEGLPTLAVAEIEGWPDTRTFMEQYVQPMKPVTIRGAVAASRAVKLWRTDDYFLNLQIGNHVDSIMVETMKKESRQQSTETLRFKEFIRTYNQSGYYMVNAVPPFLRQDVPLPGPLQCDQLYENNLVENVMWISSGGTRSVVHTDAADNINCQYVGVKTYVIVDPDKYGAQVDIDRPEGAYSAVDVDNVDYTKYPGLADVKYYVVNVSAGDCLFLPYKWIHQVRSFGRNIAVNLWFDHFKNKNVDVDKCPSAPKSEMTFEGLNFAGFNTMAEDPEAIKDHMMSLTKHREDLSLKKLMKLLTGDVESIDSVKPAKEQLLKIFVKLDANLDGLLSHTEVKETPSEVWQSVGPMFDAVMTSIDDAEQTEGSPEDGLTGDVEDAEDMLGEDDKEGAGYEETEEELKEDGNDAEEQSEQSERDEL